VKVHAYPQPFQTASSEQRTVRPRGASLVGFPGREMGYDALMSNRDVAPDQVA
jgi:hypothetical protein